MPHLDHINRTLQIALDARKNGNHPFGALLVHQGKIILEVENTVVTDRDVTQHAELRLISLASKKLERKILRECTIYSSTEPCAMCAGAIYWAGVRKVVFGLSAGDLGKMTRGSLVIESQKIFDHGNETVDVTGPINTPASAKVHENFW